MQGRKETSGLVAALKTAVFFAGVIGVVAASVYFATSGSSGAKTSPDGYQYLDINDLAAFDYQTPAPGAKIVESELNRQIPEKILRLDGRKVSITGFMMPVRVDSRGDVEEFALNGNYDMCFYGAPSRLNQWVHVKMQPGAKAKFSHNPTTVSGTLEVGEYVIDGEIVSLYRLTGDKAAGNSRRIF